LELELEAGTGLEEMGTPTGPVGALWGTKVTGADDVAG